MLAYYHENLIPFSGRLLLALVVASLFWCGDIDCFDEEAGESCGSLVCALMKSGAPAGSQDTDASGSTSCSCVCHVPTVISQTAGTTTNLLSQAWAVPANLLPPALPSSLVFRPPIAS